MKPRRMLSLAAAAVLGLVATVLFASPASAHKSDVAVDVSCDINTGQTTVVWTITPSDEPGVHFGFRDVHILPALGTVTGLATEVGFPHANGEIIKVTQVLPGDYDGEVFLEYNLFWDDGADQYNAGKEQLESGCPQVYTVTEDCNGITFTFTAPDLPADDRDQEVAAVTPHSVEVTLTPSAGDPKTITLVEGGADQTVSFPGSTGLTVKVSIPGLFEKTHAWTHAPCPLPLTGSSLTGPATIGGGLLVVGAALIAGLFVFRRRRTVAGR